jgi:hypothetical protein
MHYFNVYFFLDMSNRLINHLRNTKRFLAQNITTPFPEFAEFNSHDEIYKFSIHNPTEFWARVARSQLTFTKDFTKTSRFDLDRGEIEWFIGF